MVRNDEEGPRVIVAEDHAEMRKMVAAVLRGAGMTVSVARDGKELLELAEREPADLVVSDLSMPKLNGLLAVQKIRRLHPELPVVVMSAFAVTDEVNAAARRVGAAAVVTKPVDLIDLRRIVERVLEAA